MQSSRRPLGGPSRSDTGFVPKKNTVHQNASASAIKGLSKSSSILNKVCRERSPARAASSCHVRPRTQPSLPQIPSRSHERIVSRTPSKIRDRSVPRPPQPSAKTRRSYLSFFRIPKSVRNVRRLPPKGSESNRNLPPKPGKSSGSGRPLPKAGESDRNISPKPPKSVGSSRLLPKGSESDRNFLPKAAKSVGSSRFPPKGSESDGNFLPKAAKSVRSSRLPPKGSESDRNLPPKPSKSVGSSRLLPKGSESNRNISRPPLKGESGLNVSRLQPKAKESDRYLSRLPFRGRDSDRNLARALGNDNALKIGESDRGIPRLPIRNRDSDRNIARPVTRAKISDRNLTRPTIQSRPATKLDKTRDCSRPPPKTEGSRPTLAPASTSGIAGQTSATRVVKQKSSLVQKLAGIPSLTSPKIFSQLSLKKLSSFAFKKKASPKKTASILKDKQRPRSGGSAPSSTRLDEATQSSGPWTESVGTSTKPSRDSLGAKQKPPSNQQSQTDQPVSSRPAECLLREGEALVMKLSLDQNASRVSKRSAGRRLGPAYQHEDIFSVESFVACPENSATQREYECFCHREESPEEERSRTESVCSGESSFKPKEDYGCYVDEPQEDDACSPEMSVGEPKEDHVCREDAPTSPPTKDSVCSPDVSIAQADPCSPEICSSPHPLNLPDEVQNRASQDSSPEEEATEMKRQSKLEGSSPRDSKPKTEVALKRSQSQVGSSRQLAAPIRSLPKKGSSALKLTTSECICVPAMSSQRPKDAQAQEISSGGSNTISRSAVTRTKSVITSGTLADKSPTDNDFCPHDPASLNPRLGKDIHHPRGVQSLSDLEAVREALEKKSKGVNICPPKVPSQAPLENRQRGESASDNSVHSSALRQGTLRTSKSCVGALQLNGVQEPGLATEAAAKSRCSDIARESLTGVSHGRVSKPPPADLTSYPEEPSRGPQSRAESIEDSAGSSDARLENLEEPSAALAPSKGGVHPEKMLATHCKSESTDSTVPPPDASNLSSDGSNEKERSASGEVQREELPTADEWFHRNPTCDDKSSAKGKPPAESSSLTKQSKRAETVSKDEEILKPPLPGIDCIEQTKPKAKSPSEATATKLAAGADECEPPSSGEETKNPRKSSPPSGEERQNPRKSSLPKESSKARNKDEHKPKAPSGKSTLLSENIGTDRPVCLPQRRGTAESNDSVTRLAEQADALRAEEGTAARCEPITKLKLKKQYKEPTQSDLRDIQEDIRIWKDLYAGCLERLRSLQQMNQVPVCTNASDRDRAPDLADRPLRRTSNNGMCSINEIKGGMDEAVRVLESEYGQVESALRKHSAVLAELVSVLQNRMSAQPDAPHTDADQDAVRDVKDSIHYLKALITENETLTMQLAAERAKQQVLRQVQVTNDVVDESISATEDKLHRTNSLFKMQMKRLQYEISRLTEAHNIEMKAGTILVEQAEADVVNDLEALHTLQASNERLHELLSSKRFVSGQRVFRRASRGSFLSEEMITGSFCAIRRDQLEYTVVISDRVQRNVELSNDEIQYLHALGRRMCDQISETNEEIRKSEFAWLQLRKERDELTKELYPDLERLQKMQDVAKEKLDLESKLRKENMLFRHQLEEFQRDLLEVETELMSGAITRRTEATKNKVLELEALYESAKMHNAKLREECDSKHLTISRHDSLASLSIDEEEFQRQISEKIQRMELRIQADMDRRLLRPKRYVLEAPGKAKVSFRGQRNVIRAPKNVAEWRRKREVPQGVADPPKPQQPKDAQELRREILAKLAEEKERAKEQLLRYEAHQARQTADSSSEPNAQELNELLGRLGRFLNQTRAQEPSSAKPPSSETAPSLHGGEFGETLMHLIVQLDQLQSALTGDDSRRRTVRPPTLASERHRELLERLPDASKRGSGASNPNRQNNGNNS